MHFTYDGNLDQTKLKQGDILKRTPELVSLMSNVHPHYAREDYLYFQVLTQTCDLVPRQGKCKSRYITLAAVRSVDLIIQRAINNFTEKTVFNSSVVCSEKHKLALKSLFTKLLNNNDTEHFFLQAEPEHGLNQDCCTQLHLSISIKANEHYQTCLNAKILELNENFRAKLGWMVGNLYSRVGTIDYVPGAVQDSKTFENLIDERIKNYIVWIPEKDFSLFKKKSSTAKDFDEIMSLISDENKKSKETKLNQIVTAISKSIAFDEKQKETLKNVLNQHPLIQKIL